MTEPQLLYVTCPGASAISPPSLFSSLDAASPKALGHRMAYWEWNATGNPHHPHVVVCVHGLTRQGRDFDTLARALASHVRVVCPDVSGRGESDWLADPQGYQVPNYAADMLALLQHLSAQSAIETLDWVGTSLGGLIGMVIASLPLGVIPTPIRRLVLNDVGPVIEWSALQRIGTYLGAPARFNSVEEAASALWMLSASFGPHSPQVWRDLTRPMLRETEEGSFRLHYDPAIARVFKAMTAETARAGEAALWQAYDAIEATTLLLRGADSDLLSLETALAMTDRGPRAQLIEFQGVGHAPTLIAADQISAVAQFLLPAEAASNE